MTAVWCYENGETGSAKSCIGCKCMTTGALTVHFLDGEWFCDRCFPRKVDVYLAKQRLKKQTEGQGEGK